LTTDEVNALLDAVQSSPSFRYPERDYALILLSFRHGLRASEASNLRWDAIDLKGKTIYINRCKTGTPGNHPLQPDEVEALEASHEKFKRGCYVFQSERGTRLSEDAIASVVEKAGKLAGFSFKVHPHQLRHACGYYLANKGYDTRLIQSWLGHKSIQSTVIYTQLAAGRFDSIEWN
jgi:type 1 fimbriae regulatory protein FimB/type 1 fimbriae regulatory protein FimE